MYGLERKYLWDDITHEKFKTFANKEIVDAKVKLSGIYSLSLDNIDGVIDKITNGINSGGIEFN